METHGAHKHSTMLLLKFRKAHIHAEDQPCSERHARKASKKQNKHFAGNLGRAGNNFLPRAKIKLSYRLCKTEDTGRKLNVSNVQASRNGFGRHPTFHGEIPDLWVPYPCWAACGQAQTRRHSSLAATSPIPS